MISSYGDPFNADSDGDGISDGNQATGPESTIPWAERASKTDVNVDWKKAPEYRYAVFPIVPPNLGGAPAAPLQIDSAGRVLFRQHQWVGGQLKLLLGDFPAAYAASGEGDILGMAQFDGGANKVAWWKSIDAQPVPVEVENFAPLLGALSDKMVPLADVFSDDGVFSLPVQE